MLTKFSNKLKQPRFPAKYVRYACAHTFDWNITTDSNILNISYYIYNEPQSQKKILNMTFSKNFMKKLSHFYISKIFFNI